MKRKLKIKCRYEKRSWVIHGDRFLLFFSEFDHATSHVRHCWLSTSHVRHCWLSTSHVSLYYFCPGRPCCTVFTSCSLTCEQVYTGVTPSCAVGFWYHTEGEIAPQRMQGQADLAAGAVQEGVDEVLCARRSWGQWKGKGVSIILSVYSLYSDKKTCITHRSGDDPRRFRSEESWGGWGENHISIVELISNLLNESTGRTQHCKSI